MGYHCTHFPEAIIEMDGVTYYAADADCVPYFRGDLVLNLSNSRNVDGAMAIPELSKHFDITFQELMIPWRDGGLPNVKQSFWPALHKYILSKGYTDVCVHCYAGHGRTGTMLASMMVAVGGWGAKESVEFLRGNYCKNVVETEAQCLHLQELDYIYNNVEPTEANAIEPSYSFRKSYGTGGWHGHWLD